MAAAKTERLLNLVICLLATSRYLTKEQVRRAVPGYSESDEAFERMFERDKELRQLGIGRDGAGRPLLRRRGELASAQHLRAA